MKSITPYSLAFTFFRIVAFLYLLRGIYDFFSYFRPNSGPAEEVGPMYLFGIFVQSFLPGALLYNFAHWFAKLTIWKLKP